MQNIFEDDNKVNGIWLDTVSKVLKTGKEVHPRGLLTHEIMGGSYRVPMPAFIDLVSRDVKAPFMFSEAAWIISGSNLLSHLTPYMKVYSKFSDDGKFLRGAYGPKVVDQLSWVVDTLMSDNESRQAVMTTWRERPGPSKDIPCTVAMQFLIRDEVLHMIVTMRSNDIILGFTYDVFTFSMVANTVRVLLKERGLDIILGDLQVNAGSLHIYEQHFEDYANKWEDGVYERDISISRRVMDVMKADTYEELIRLLKDQAHDAKFYPERYHDK